MAAEVGGLLVNLGLDVAQIKQDVGKAQRELSGFRNKVDRQMSRAQRSVSKLTSGFKGLAAAIGAQQLGAAIGRTLSNLEDINRQARSLGASREVIQELTFTFRQFNLQQDDVSDALGTLSDRAQDAKDGMKSFQEDFQLLNISVQDLKDKSPGELFDLVARKVATIEDPTRRTAAVVRIFGDDLGRKLLPLLQQGAEGLDKYAKRARELGVVISDELVKDSAKAAKDFRALKEVLTAQFASAIAENADALSTTAMALKDIAVWGAQAASELVKIGQEMQTSAGEVNNFKTNSLGGVNAELERLQENLKQVQQAGGAQQVTSQLGTEEQLQKNIRQLQARRSLLRKELRDLADADIATNREAFGNFGAGDTGGGSDGEDKRSPVLLGRVGRRGRGQSSYVQDLMTIQEQTQQVGEETQRAGDTIIETQNNIQNNQIQVNQEFQRTGEIVGDAFRSATREGATLRGVVQGLLRDLAQMQVNRAAGNISSGVSSILTSAFMGGSSTGALSSVGGVGGATPRSFAGGGYTGNGPRTGGVDGQGGFPAILHPRETVTDSTQPQRGGDTYYIDASGADKQAIARLEAQIRSLNGSVERRALTAVNQQRARRPSR